MRAKFMELASATRVGRRCHDAARVPPPDWRGIDPSGKWSQKGSWSLEASNAGSWVTCIVVVCNTNAAGRR